MKATVSGDAEQAIGDIARRHELSREAVLAMLFAVNAGGGTMAQFSIPELGGSGQWMRGGMTMVGGNMFDNALKARVDALCGELAQLLATTTVFPTAPLGFTSGTWWPPDLGVPSSSGRKTMPATRSSRRRGGWLSRSAERQEFSTPANIGSAVCNSSRVAAATAR